MTGIAYIYRQLIGEHWFETPIQPEDYSLCVGYLDKRIDEIPEGKSFIFLTDPHCYRTHTGEFQVLNTMKSPAIIGYIGERTGIRNVVMGGDIVERADNKFLGIKEMDEYIRKMTAVSGERFLVVHGNHDLNTANAPIDDVDTYLQSYEATEKTLFSHIKRNTEDVSEKLARVEHTPEQEKEFLCYSRLHYYVDDDQQKMRYIILDTGCPGSGRNGCVEEMFGIYNNSELVLQYEWLYETLKSTPQGYDIAIAGHALVGYGGNENIPTVTLGTCKIISGYKTRSKVCIDNDFTRRESVAKYFGRTVHQYDFSDLEYSGNVVVMAGDVHWDIQAKADYDSEGNFVSTPYGGEKLSDTAVVVNVVQTDSHGCSHYEKCFNMVPGTRSEQCLDIVTICPDGNIRMTRIGAGKDRYLNIV